MPQELLFGVDLDRAIEDIRNGKGPWRLEWSGMAVLRELSAHRGGANPISLRDLAERSRLNVRELKSMVRSLVVDFGLPIGASRSTPSGYYLAETAAERLNTARPYVREIRNLAVRVRALVGAHDFTELLGQMRLDAGEEGQI